MPGGESGERCAGKSGGERALGGVPARKQFACCGGVGTRRRRASAARGRGALAIQLLVARACDGEIWRASDAGRGSELCPGAPLVKAGTCPAIFRRSPRRLKERQLYLKKRQLHLQEFRGILTEFVEKQAQIARHSGGIVVKLRIGEKLAGAAIGRIQIGRDLL